jgi:hypothetical protein
MRTPIGERPLGKLATPNGIGSRAEPTKGEGIVEGVRIDRIIPTCLPGFTGKECQIGAPKGLCAGVKIFFIIGDFRGVQSAPLIACEGCAKTISEVYGVPITEWVDEQPYGNKESWPWWNIELDCGNGGLKTRFRFRIQAPTSGRAEELAFEGVEAEYFDVDTIALEISRNP